MEINEQISISETSVTVEILQSALKHGITVTDILFALDHTVYDETITVDPNQTLIVGFDASANPIEVIFHVLSDEKIVVFYAMRCRKKYMAKTFER